MSLNALTTVGNQTQTLEWLTIRRSCDIDLALEHTEQQTPDLKNSRSIDGQSLRNRVASNLTDAAPIVYHP